jgi:hypothetical protein
MKSLRRKLNYAAIAIVAAFGLASLAPAAASASNESASMSFDMAPRSGVFYKQAYRPANWSISTTISTSDPEILPMTRAALTLPRRGQMTFNPSPRMPVCPDSQVGPPPTNVSVSVDEIVRRCGSSIIGNGTATFVLGRNNLNPAAFLDGYIVVLNGGRVGGDPKLKVYAYSYDTGVGIYTDGLMTAQGRLVFDIPILTADSAVSELNLNIPGRPERISIPRLATEFTLPGGRDGAYVRTRCAGSGWGYQGVFTLNRRDNAGQPIGEPSFVSDAGLAACRGAVGSPSLRSVAVRGPRWLPVRGTRVYRVYVRNGGTSMAKGVRIRVGGRWVRSASRRVANIPAGRTRAYNIRVGLNTRQARRHRRQATVIRFVANAPRSRARGANYRIRVR